MNTEFFIARRIYKGDKENSKRVSSPAIKIAIIGIALGLAVMIISVCIVIGFKKEVREKIIGFISHIQVTSLEVNNSYEHQPIAFSTELRNKLTSNDDISHVQSFITKPGIIKTKDDFQGIVLKGVSDDYDWKFFSDNLVEGNTLKDVEIPDGSYPALISKSIANKLHFKLGDSFHTYFIDNPVRVRKFKIVGIYSSNFEEYDKVFIITDKKILTRLNHWEDDMVSGIEVYIKDFEKLDQVSQRVFFQLSNMKDRLGNSYYSRSVKSINPIIFNWLDLLDMNVWIIIILMIAVSGVTIISGILIIILERTNMIGILKALGTSDMSIQKIFLYLSSHLIIQGMFWGNAVALAFCLLQKYFHIIRLNPSVYYLSSVPIDMNIWYIILLNVGTLIISILMMVGPSFLVSKITPAKSIRFE